GSLLLGLIVQIAEVKAGPGLWMRVFLTVGICGGFTTFSTFSLETFRLLQDGSYLFAAGNIVGSLVLCIIGIWVGMVIGRLL
ncbi:MAG: CrcB family protein, partial [Bacteroidetes bacterium]|nr:CrcB family protein [Bacteroidota bacterium]